MPAVVDAEPCCDDVTQASTNGEGDHEFFARHPECARCKDEGAERHGWRKDGGQGDGEDGVVFHPLADALEDARGNAMMSVTPGRGRGIKELSTMETRKTPKNPKLKRKCTKGLRAPRGEVAA